MTAVKWHSGGCLFRSRMDDGADESWKDTFETSGSVTFVSSTSWSHLYSRKKQKKQAHLRSVPTGIPVSPEGTMIQD